MSLVSVLAGGIAFVLTFPRAGDEMLLLWLFITPAFILATIVLLASAIPLTIIVLGSKDFSRGENSESLCRITM
jgi:hypothetical protein